MEIKMNEKRTAILEALKTAEKPMTLAELATAMGVEKIATGTTNAMVKAGLIRKAGTVKVAKVVYVEVATYELGEATPAAKQLTSQPLQSDHPPSAGFYLVIKFYRYTDTDRRPVLPVY